MTHISAIVQIPKDDRVSVEILGDLELTQMSCGVGPRKIAR